MSRRNTSIQGKRLRHVLRENTQTARNNKRNLIDSHRNYYDEFSSAQRQRGKYDYTSNRIFNNSITLKNYDSDEKDSKKKSINYMNYSKIDHDIITNKPVDTTYSSFRERLLKYEPQKYEDTTKPRFYKRKPCPVNILKNINYVSNLSKLNSLKKEIKIRNSTSMSNTRKNDDLRAGGKYLFFKRKNSHLSRRFNEVNSSHQKLKDKLNQSRKSNSRAQSDMKCLDSYSMNSAKKSNTSSVLKRLKRNATAESTVKKNKYESIPQNDTKVNNNHQNMNPEEIEQLFHHLKQKLSDNHQGDDLDKLIKRLELLKKFILQSNSTILETLKSNPPSNFTPSKSPKDPCHPSSLLTSLTDHLKNPPDYIDHPLSTLSSLLDAWLGLPAQKPEERKEETGDRCEGEKKAPESVDEKKKQKIRILSRKLELEQELKREKQLRRKNEIILNQIKESLLKAGESIKKQ
ncbi:unnamed protein product [Moneuplotes crassus]|uniref:Uncharacterized protein n=1 Tax=Euplotes crassus TaxID=5936 RepID=A0AAD1UD52_EUPCR|nr:unnamed protein product [Moneuplotes crassus]